MSSSNSSSPKTFVVGLAAMKKKTTMNNPKQGSPQKLVSKRTITAERPRFGLGVVRAEKDMMKKYQPKDDTPHICKICWRGFSTGNALGFHQNTHKFERELERQLKKMEPSFLMKPCNSIFGGLHESTGGDGSSVRTTTFPSLTSTFPPFTRGTTYMDMDVVVGYPVSPYRSLNGNTSYGNYNHHTLSNANHLGLSSGPLKSRGVGSMSNIVSSSLYNGGTSGGNTVMNMTMVPPATPYRSFTEKTSYVSSSRDPLPSQNDSPHALSPELSLGPDNPIGTSSNNNKSSRTLELSLGPSKTIGGGNTNSIVDPSLKGGVKKVITDLNMPVRPRVSRYQFHGHNPLDSITRNVPLLVSPPPPTTNLSNDENVSGSSYSEKSLSKEKKKLGGASR